MASGRHATLLLACGLSPRFVFRARRRRRERAEEIGVEPSIPAPFAPETLTEEIGVAAWSPDDVDGPAADPPAPASEPEPVLRRRPAGAPLPQAGAKGAALPRATRLEGPAVIAAPSQPSGYIRRA
jgi:hypothetical protein